ncbi:MAG: type IX secretion system protein PorQ [Bacteroidota bacterium]
MLIYIHPSINNLRFSFTIIFFLSCAICTAQTIGGNAVYNFLKLPATPMLTATGGVNTSYHNNDVGVSLNNPSLLKSNLHGQINFSFNGLPGGIKAYSAGGAYHHTKSNATFGAGVFFIDYGSTPQTDAAGNVSGNFRPVDFALQLSAAKKYLEKWSYGATIKFIYSGYSQYSSNAIAVDAGVLYDDTAAQFSISFLAQNMGMQLKSYAGEKEDLPFDMQLGFTKRLAKAPLGFSVTAQSIHRFNILYNDTLFNNDNGTSANNSFLPKLFLHFVIATHIYLGPHLEAAIGYNHLRRSELQLPGGGSGLAGFSTGLRLKFNKLEVQFARSGYASTIAYNQLGITVNVQKLISPL